MPFPRADAPTTITAPPDRRSASLAAWACAVELGLGKGSVARLRRCRTNRPTTHRRPPVARRLVRSRPPVGRGRARIPGRHALATQQRRRSGQPHPRTRPGGPPRPRRRGDRRTDPGTCGRPSSPPAARSAPVEAGSAGRSDSLVSLGCPAEGRRRRRSLHTRVGSRRPDSVATSRRATPPGAGSGSRAWPREGRAKLEPSQHEPGAPVWSAGATAVRSGVAGLIARRGSRAAPPDRPPRGLRGRHQVSHWTPSRFESHTKAACSRPEPQKGDPLAECPPGVAGPPRGVSLGHDSIDRSGHGRAPACLAF